MQLSAVTGGLQGWGLWPVESTGYEEPVPDSGNYLRLGTDSTRVFPLASPATALTEASVPEIRPVAPAHVATATAPAPVAGSQARPYASVTIR